MAQRTHTRQVTECSAANVFAGIRFECVDMQALGMRIRTLESQLRPAACVCLLGRMSSAPRGVGAHGWCRQMPYETRLSNGLQSLLQYLQPYGLNWRQFDRSMVRVQASA